MRAPRPLVWLLLIAVAVSAAVGLYGAYDSFSSSGSPLQNGWISTTTGALGPADRDTLTKIHQMNLWVHPVGQQMHQRGQQVRVRDIGDAIAAETTDLDTITVIAAEAVGMTLPTQPTDQQMETTQQITNASGAAYDALAVNSIRTGDVDLLIALATERAESRNSTIRTYAQQAEIVVEHHMSYLDSTGLVNFDALPTPPTSTRTTPATPVGYTQTPVAAIALGAVLILTIVVWLSISAMRQKRIQRVYSSRYDSHRGPPRDHPETIAATSRHRAIPRPEERE